MGIGGGDYLIGQGPAIDQGSASNKHHNIYNTEIRGNQMINFVYCWVLDLIYWYRKMMLRRLSEV